MKNNQNKEIPFLINNLHTYEKSLDNIGIAHLIEDARKTIEDLLAQNNKLENELENTKKLVDQIIYEGHEGEDYL